MEEKRNFKIVISEYEYIDTVISHIEKILQEKLPQSMRNKAIIIELVDTI